jgi:hypothetical protein
MIRWWKQWRQRRRDEPIAQRAKELREFVYLDDVSVTSLLSSRLGKLPSEFTDTLASTSKAEVNANAEASAATILKSRIGSRYEASRTENSQVLSKATIQATFKRLYDIEEEAQSLVLRPVLPDEQPPAIEKIRKVLALGASNADMYPWIVIAENLKRGRLAEMEVELQADPAFRVSAIFTTFKELTDESADLLGQTDRLSFDKAIEVNRVLEKLMGGLVPLRCRLVDYEVISTRGQTLLIHRRVLEQLPQAERPTTQPLYLVGVAEQSLFWKDIRRVLFSGARFRVLCRLNYEGLRTTWTAVKMVDVLGEVAPTLKSEMDIFGQGMLKLLAENGTTRGKFIEPRLRALSTYGDQLAQHLGFELDDDDRRQIETFASESADLVISVPESRKAFTQITEFISMRSSSEIDPIVAADLRVSACRQYGLTPGGSAVRTETAAPSRAIEDNGGNKFLDSEIIAIYW